MAAQVSTAAGQVIRLTEGRQLVFGRGPEADLAIAAGRHQHMGRLDGAVQQPRAVDGLQRLAGPSPRSPPATTALH